MKRTTLLLVTALSGSLIAGCTFDEAATYCKKTFVDGDEYSACIAGITSIEAQNQELCKTAYPSGSGKNESLFNICVKAAEKYKSALSTPTIECKVSGAYKCR